MKNCPLCGSKNKGEALACIHCSHPFGKTLEVASAPKVSTAPKPPKPKKGKKEEVVEQPVEPAKEEKPAVRKRRYAGVSGTVIWTPAGLPPCKPTTEAGATDTEIEEWACGVLDKGRDQNKEYSINAIQYFARRFWGGEELSHACRVIHRALSGPVETDDI